MVENNLVKTKLGLGSSDTKAKDIASSNIGALDINKYLALGKGIIGERKETNPWLHAFQYFSNMAAEASKPGATALGAAGQAGNVLAKSLIEENKAKRAEELAGAGLGIKLATALGKPKKGVPKPVDMGPVMDTDGKTPLKNADGVVLHKFNVYSPSGQEIIKTYNAPQKTGMSIDLVSQKSFAGVAGKQAAEDFTNKLVASDKAFSAMSEMNTLLNLLADPNFETGTMQSALLPVKTLFLSLPQSARDVLGITQKDFDNVATAESFQALGYSVVLAKVEQMKGALSNKELGFLAAQGPTLSKTKDGNKLIIALSMQQLGKTSKFQDFSIEWQEEHGEIKTKLDYQKLIRDFRKQDFMEENPYQYVHRIASEEIHKRVINAGGAVDQDGEIENIDTETLNEIANSVSDKFGLRTLERIFKNREDKNTIWR